MSEGELSKESGPKKGSGKTIHDFLDDFAILIVGGAFLLLYFGIWKGMKFYESRPSVARTRLDEFVQQQMEKAAFNELPDLYGIETHLDPDGRSGRYVLPDAQYNSHVYTFEVDRRHELIWRNDDPFRATLKYQVLKGLRGQQEWHTRERHYHYESGYWTEDED